MNARSALLIALVAAGYVSHPQSPAPSSRTPQRTTAATAASTSIVYDKQLEVEDWPRETMHQFFTTRAVAKEEAGQDVCPYADGTTVDLLIATVPDPEQSHYPVMFDRFVESIRRASEESGYTLDRFWIPWEAEAGPPDGDWLKHEQHQDWLSRKRAYPGVLVFQQPVKGGKLRVSGVLLIGENPISGINKEQFVNALSLMKHFKGSELGTVRILGPTFSGSTHSLAIAMTELIHDADVTVTDYQAITGSATGYDNKTNLENYCKAQNKPDCPKISYDATIENDQVAINSFFSYLDPDFGGNSGVPGRGRSHEVELERVAILAESGSRYASQIVDFVSKSQAGARILEYPMEISHLRNAYEDDPELSVLSSAKVSDQPRHGLQIKLRDSHAAEDSMPTFSPELTPASQEAALSNILATISRERIQYVGIIASDVLDSIFLSHLLKQHCPDVRLFIFDSDLLYGNIAQNNAFQGMTMVTSYPLFASNQRWTDSWANRKTRQFASGTAEGVYNACIMLLNQREDQDHQTRLAEYGAPYLKPPLSRPALWLTVVGRDGVWPLTPLDLDAHQPHQDPPQKSAKVVPQDPPTRAGIALPLLDDPSRGWLLE